MDNYSQITALECIDIVQKSSIFQYWGTETQQTVIDLINSTSEDALPKIMEDFMVQENKIKLSEAQETKEKKRAQLFERRAKTKLLEKKEQEQAQAYAEKLIASLDTDVEKKIPRARKKFLGLF